MLYIAIQVVLSTFNNKPDQIQITQSFVILSHKIGKKGAKKSSVQLMLSCGV